MITIDSSIFCYRRRKSNRRDSLFKFKIHNKDELFFRRAIFSLDSVAPPMVLIQMILYSAPAWNSTPAVNAAKDSSSPGSESSESHSVSSIIVRQVGVEGTT